MRIPLSAWINLFLLIINITDIYGRSKAFLRKFENCEPNIDYICKYNLSLTSIGDQQYVSGGLVLKAPLDNNILTNVTVHLLAGRNYVPLLVISEKKSCDALHKYLGEFAYDLERKIGILVGACPIAKGRYYVHNASLDLEKVTTLTNFPFGILRFVSNSYNRHGGLYTCLLVEIEK